MIMVAYISNHQSGRWGGGGEGRTNHLCYLFRSLLGWEIETLENKQLLFDCRKFLQKIDFYRFRLQQVKGFCEIVFPS